jgi:maleate cis-trans isomerase
MYGWRLKIGIVSPANNVVIEPELYRALPEGIAIYTTRMLIGVSLSMESLVAME